MGKKYGTWSVAEVFKINASHFWKRLQDIREIFWAGKNIFWGKETQSVSGRINEFTINS